MRAMQAMVSLKKILCGGQMANKANQNDVIPLREALNMEIIINQALIDILVAKGIITQEELMAKIEEIKKEIPCNV